MIELNHQNGADAITHRVAKTVLDKFQGPLTGAEFGIAYGGGVETIGKLWQGRGIIHGFDTFEGHPKQLSYSPSAKEFYCMDFQYAQYGREALSYEHQRNKLDSLGLYNVHLHKGLINDHSIDGIEAFHYVLLDLDFVLAMLHASLLVKDRIVPGGYLCLHDVLPRGHIYGLWGLYQEIIAEGRWSAEEYPDSYLAVLCRK